MVRDLKEFLVNAKIVIDWTVPEIDVRETEGGGGREAGRGRR
jgi:hypothetical protein